MSRSCARVLVLSSRGIRRTLFNSALYEFEDVVAGFDEVDLYCPSSYHGDLRFDVARASHLAGAAVGRRGRGRRPLVPYRRELVPQNDYDLLFATFDNPWDLGLVHTVDRFRERCAKVACYMPEVWSNTLGMRRFRLENFVDYDHIFIGTDNDVARFAEVSGVPCTSFAPAVDNLRFSPVTRAPERVVDVVNLGRRMPGTHEALLRLARETGRFYLYDDVLNGEFPEPSAHREWLADVLLRSRYAIANFARCDRPDLTHGTREMGYRHVEGAASGLVMLGEPPNTAQFAEQFPWPEAIIPTPVDAPGIGEVITRLDEDPERLARISARNVAGSLRRHDWVYRWELVLRTLGMRPTAAMAERKALLEREAARWDACAAVGHDALGPPVIATAGG